MRYEQLIHLFFDFEYESNNFKDFKFDLLLENPKYLYLFRYLLGNSKEDYAKIFSVATYDELKKKINKKKIDSKQAEEYHGIINVYLNHLDKLNVKPSKYLEVIIDNFFKEDDGNKLIFHAKADKLVSSKFLKPIAFISLMLSYFGLALSFSQKISLNNEPFIIFLIFFSILTILTFLRMKYYLSSDSKILYLAYIIQQSLDNNPKLISFSKEYLLQISNEMRINKRIKEINPVLDEISDIFFDFDEFIKNKLINQIDKGNFTEVSSILKNIGLQKTKGCLTNYIEIKKYIKEIELNFENQPYKKTPKFKTTINYSNNLANCFVDLFLKVKSITFEILPYFFIAVIISYTYYRITNDLTNTTIFFTGICILLAIPYNKRK